MSDQKGGAERVNKLISTYGCLPYVGELSTIDRFDAPRLAAAIRNEIGRASDYGWTKVTLHMDIPDAAELARHLSGER